MKKLIIWIITLVLLSAILPIAAGIGQLNKAENVKINQINQSANQSSTQDETIELSAEDTDILINTVMNYITEKSDTECKKAVVALCKNNAMVQKRKNEAIKTSEISNYSDSLYKEIKQMIEDDSTDITFNGNRVYIPIVKLCPGYIVENENYPYIAQVACPWDTLTQRYNKDAEYQSGISINGIESLCSLGFDNNYVLSYFLPLLNIN